MLSIKYRKDKKITTHFNHFRAPIKETCTEMRVRYHIQKLLLKGLSFHYDYVELRDVCQLCRVVLLIKSKLKFVHGGITL